MKTLPCFYNLQWLLTYLFIAFELDSPILEAIYVVQHFKEEDAKKFLLSVIESFPKCSKRFTLKSSLVELYVERDRLWAESNEKYALLYELFLFEKRGHRPKRFSPKSSVEEMRAECKRLENQENEP